MKTLYARVSAGAWEGYREVSRNCGVSSTALIEAFGLLVHHTEEEYPQNSFGEIVIEIAREVDLARRSRDEAEVFQVTIDGRTIPLGE